MRKLIAAAMLCGLSVFVQAQTTTVNNGENDLTGQVGPIRLGYKALTGKPSTPACVTANNGTSHPCTDKDIASLGWTENSGPIIYGGDLKLLPSPTQWSFYDSEKGKYTARIKKDDSGTLRLMIGDETVALVDNHKLYVKAGQNAADVLAKLLEVVAK